jgi:hypothetical protein
LITGGIEEGKIAVITGGNRWTGIAMAQWFVQEGVYYSMPELAPYNSKSH